MGRVVEVCGKVARELYSKRWLVKFSDADQGLQYPMPFYGLASKDGALWASSADGIYRIDQAGVTRISASLRFKRIGQFCMSFDLRGLVLLDDFDSTESCPNNDMPLIVAR